MDFQRGASFLSRCVRGQSVTPGRGGRATSTTSVWACLVQKAWGGVVQLTDTKLLGFRSRVGVVSSVQAGDHTCHMTGEVNVSNERDEEGLTQAELQHRLIRVLTVPWTGQEGRR